MKIALIHLSDIHLINGNNVVVRRARAIGNAARAAAADAEHSFLLVSGDIAYSGKAVEYTIASRFFERVLESIQSDGMGVTLAMAPGNHDCDFESGSRLRPLILDNKTDVLGTALDEETIRACTSVQRSFIEFRDQYGSQGDLKADRMTSHSVRKEINGHRILINCITLRGYLVERSDPATFAFRSLPTSETAMERRRSQSRSSTIRIRGSLRRIAGHSPRSSK